MDERLERALEPVLLDLRRTGSPVPEFFDEDWTDDATMATAIMGRVGSNLVGVSMTIAADQIDRIVEVADQVQEWAIEELWPTSPTNWPLCPNHPATHPLSASTRDGAARWVCPRDGTPFDPIGSLGSSLGC